jgi:predicted NAD/FAD-binding protein
VRRIAIIGSGIAGLGAAHALRHAARVTLFEADDHFGGHAHTVDLTLDGVTHGVDTGFLVLNARTYPNLLRLFAGLDVELAKSDMSFSVQVPEARLEWSGASLGSVFAQRSNALDPRFWRMLADVVRFNRVATAIALDRDSPGGPERTIGDFLAEQRFSAAFRDWYFLPMIGCIWSCPTAQMLRFPLATLIRFCHNHGLLQVADRPQWYTVKGGSRRYVERIVDTIPDARLRTSVRRVRRATAHSAPGEGVVVATDRGSERFDAVVLACHSDQALALLEQPTEAERAVLGAIGYQRNRALLHTDIAVLPRRRRAWAAWNYERGADADGAGVCLHYLIDRLQPLPFGRPVIVSLNPLREPAAGAVHGEFDYAHPVFDAAAIAAQARVPELQGVGNVWFCGAWTRYGFHEDGLRSALAVCDDLQRRLGTEMADIPSTVAA